VGVLVRALAVATLIAGCSSYLGSEDDELPTRTAANDGGPADTGVLVAVDTGASDAGSLGCNGAADCERVVFVTSSELPGNFGGVAKADRQCQIHADGSNHPRVRGRHFVAWVGTVGSRVVDRFVKGSKPYVRPDGMVLANDWASLTSASLQHTLSLTEDGDPVGGDDFAWTGTNTSGSSSSNTCADWTSADAMNSGQRGVPSKTNNWTDDDKAACNLSGHIYCFEE